MVNYKFDPLLHGFIKGPDNDGDFIMIKNSKVVAELVFINYTQGIKYEWCLNEIIHTDKPQRNTLFCGSIPDNVFAKQLFINTLTWLKQ